ncbi:hypothetical protein V2J09_007391 [Rumex salicifolius]
MGCFRGSGSSSKKKRSQTFDCNYNKESEDRKQFTHDNSHANKQLDAKEEVPTMKEENKEGNPTSDPSVRNGNLQEAHTFTYQEMVDATENFRPDSFLGQGGFGKVYKGILKNTNQAVAIKQLDRNGLQGIKEFVVEVMTLNLADHPNLVKLLGYCAEGEQRLLVYEFMPLGSLESQLLDMKPDQTPLDWNTRMKIAAGAAMGLEYLHDKMTPPIIYRDLKCSNILLGENYHPKLSDFGLAKVGPQGDNTHVSTRVMGTYGYCAPDYAMTGQLTFKSDIYSFGVFLLELITGRKAIDSARVHEEQNLVAWARPLFRDRKKFSEMADPGLKDQYPTRGLYQVLAIAAMCVQEQPNMRPLVADVVTALNYLAAHKYDPQNSASSHGSRRYSSVPVVKNDDDNGSQPCSDYS